MVTKQIKILIMTLTINFVRIWNLCHKIMSAAAGDARNRIFNTYCNSLLLLGCSNNSRNQLYIAGSQWLLHVHVDLTYWRLQWNLFYRSGCRSEWGNYRDNLHARSEWGNYCDNLHAKKLLPDIFRISQPSQGGVLSFSRTVHWRTEHETPSLSLSERCPMLFLQHWGRLIHGIWTQSTIASGVYLRRKFADPE